MKKLGKLSINLEKVMKNDELVTLRGGYGEACDCGSGVQAWFCTILYNGYYAFSGVACGTQQYILNTYPPEAGFSVACDGGGICEDGVIGRTHD